MSDDRDEFLPCPFCGSTIVGALQESSVPTDRLGVVGCGVCGARGPCHYEDHELALKWNQRINRMRAIVSHDVPLEAP